MNDYKKYLQAAKLAMSSRKFDESRAYATLAIADALCSIPESLNEMIPTMMQNIQSNMYQGGEDEPDPFWICSQCQKPRFETQPDNETPICIECVANSDSNERAERNETV